MSTFAHTLRRVIRRRDGGIETAPEPGLAVPDDAATLVEAAPAVDIAPNDPLLAYLQTAGGAVELDRLELDSPAVERAARAAGVALVVPLVIQRRADRAAQPRPAALRPAVLERRPRLLDILAAQAAPALQVAAARPPSRQAEAASRERIEQELQVAQLIQQNFLPSSSRSSTAGSSPPTTSRRVRSAATSTTSSSSPDGQLGLVVGDVTDKGVPAAMVMAATRSVLRATASQRRSSRRGARARVNDLLCPDIPTRCSSPACTASSTRRRAVPLRERRPQPAVRAHRPTASTSCARPACRSG